MAGARRLYTAVGQTGRGIGTALLARLEASLGPGTTYRAIVHAHNDRGLRFPRRQGFAVVGDVYTREHFNAHRDISFDDTSEPEPSLVIVRTVT